MCKTRDYMLFMLQYREARFEMIFYHCIRQDCQKCCNKFLTAVRNEQYWYYNMVYKYSDSTLGNDATSKVCKYTFFQDKMYTACYVFQLRIVTMQIFDDLWTPAISLLVFYLQKVKNLLLSRLPSSQDIHRLHYIHSNVWNAFPCIGSVINHNNLSR